MSNIFQINPLAAPWEGLYYSVSWPGRGIVKQQRYVMLEQAFETGDYRIGISNGKEAVRVNADVVFDKTYQPEFLDHMFSSVTELTSVAFTERKYAEDFVYRMEKIIVWKALSRYGSTENL